MALQSKDSPLNQPYYGPPIPPSQSPPHNSPPKLNLYSLLCTITKISTIFLITIGLIILSLWLIYQPQSIKIYAESAALPTFNLSLVNNNSLLTYDLAINFSFRNPNSKYVVYYERVKAQALYGGEEIGSTEFAPARQGRKSTMPLAARFSGRAAVGDGEGYARERKDGFFDVGVRMFVTVRLKMIVVESVRFKPDVDCYLRIPAAGNSTSAGVGFVRTECDVRNFS